MSKLIKLKNILSKLLLSGKHVQRSIITDFLVLQAPLERNLTAVRENVVFETLHDFYRTAIILKENATHLREVMMRMN